MGLIEAIVGLALIATCILALNGLVVAMIRGNLTAQLLDQATRLADSKLNDLVSAGYANLTVGTTTDSWWSAGTTGVRFDRTTTIAAGTVTGTRAITVSVAWKDRVQRVETFTTEVSQ
jgi:Tfp pilus assembly protein PilV